MISLIAALNNKYVIGNKGDIPWKIPDDLKRFKKKTLNHPVIMGRITWESIPEKFRPLPSRTNIILTRDRNYKAPGAYLAESLEDAIALGQSSINGSEVFVIGGERLYRASLPIADRLYLTLVNSDESGDAFFPEYKHIFSKEVLREEHNYEGLRYTFLDLER